MADRSEPVSAAQALANVARDENKLFHSAYVRGVSEFIKNCATPMTIAIQGDTGMGKSTLINLMEKELRAEMSPDEQDDPDEPTYDESIIGVAIVDVLMQSTAKPKSDLFIFLLSKILPRLSGSDLVAMAGVSEFASAATQIADAMDADKKASEEDDPLSAILGAIFGYEETAKSASDENADRDEILGSIEELRSALVEALKQSAERNGKTEDARFVVFVDGLDHISPETALTLLEQIDAYISCPRLIFVFAIDERIVLEGVRKKLGDKVDERRQKMIFDRLVHTPLYIPSGTYDLSRFIRDLLTDEDEKARAGEFVEVIDTLMRAPTPHRIKRCLNSTYLYRSILSESGEVDGSLLAMLFAAVILRIESPQGFAAVARCAQGSDEGFAENLQAALESLQLSDELNLAKLPALWGEGDDVDAEKRAAFLSWVRRLV